MKFQGMKGRNPLMLSVPLGALCLCGVSTQSAQAQTVQAQSADAFLSAVRASEAKIEYSATQVVQRGSEREVSKIYRDGFKRRIEWLSPEVKKGDVMVDDGTSVTLFHRSDKSAIRTQSQRRLPNLVGSDWKVGAPVRQNGMLVRVLSRPNGRKLSVDAKTKAIVRMEGMRGVTTLQNVDYGAVPASKFVFALPAGAKLTQINGQLFNDLRSARRGAGWFKAPTALPSGYNFESAIVGPSEVWLRYSNGQKRFSIFQQKAEGGDLKPQAVNGGWFWKSGGLRFLATDAPDGSVNALASSLK
jgi:outer membrane lipoprotein-sorting protein